MKKEMKNPVYIKNLYYIIIIRKKYNFYLISNKLIVIHYIQ